MDKIREAIEAAGKLAAIAVSNPASAAEVQPLFCAVISALQSQQEAEPVGHNRNSDEVFGKGLQVYPSPTAQDSKGSVPEGELKAQALRDFAGTLMGAIDAGFVEWDKVKPSTIEKMLLEEAESVLSAAPSVAEKAGWLDPMYYPPSDDDEDENGCIFAVNTLGSVNRISAHECRRDTDIYSHWFHTHLYRPLPPEGEQ
ncbi:hypothetical protein Mag101_07290 [Microbulbifer agarilyticus]|uniref:Uncharacterized protein n=1 Tax=Microbulbifer agarilyticus TaxID=260552 RepID=A0A1Q2M5G1_9GAMM|nr:hypothetical protein [Microbulbifer agarilyticus]AQQ67462.1 hypothetical protein Mag101_07290 [Microbulbifer agarilyticus]